MHENPREKDEYIRFLELVVQITEDWGKATERINNYIGKGWDQAEAEAAYKKLIGLQSPMNELTAFLELNMNLKKE